MEWVKAIVGGSSCCLRNAAARASMMAIHGASMVGIQMKTVGRRRPSAQADAPAENLRRAERLIREMDLLNPWPRPRGFVFKAKTYADYERWRRAQKKPRLW